MNDHTMQGSELIDLNDTRDTSNPHSNQEASEDSTTARIITQVPEALRLQYEAMSALFGPLPMSAQSWPGILVFCNCLEKWFDDLLTENFAIIWIILGRTKATHSHEVWHWWCAVLKALQDYSTENPAEDPNDTASLESVYQALIAGRSAHLGPIDQHQKLAALQATFAVICWASLALRPVLAEEPSNMAHVRTSILRAEESNRTVSLVQFSKRPVCKLFRGFRILSSDDVGGEQTQQYSPYTTTLFESSVNFYSLYTTGKLRVRWVDTLAGHLSWNRQSRTISIFRLPSFCASSIRSERNVKLLSLVQAEILPSQTYQDMPLQDCSSMHRELLLTYRLLFGQSSRPRKLAQELLAQLKKTGKEVDPLLQALCTTPRSQSVFGRLLSRKTYTELPSELFPPSTIDVNNVLMESGSYSAQHDFPVFGSRLLALQEYNLRQQPSRVRDLWRDRRNPLQWYTFWAVIWVGGITIFLGVFQLAVAAGQLYYATKS